MSTTIFNARVSFEPRSKKASNGEEFVLLNASKRAGKDSNGQPVYNEYHLTVWGRDVALARNLGVGDYITFTIEREQLEVWTGKDGKSRPYLSGNVRNGELCAVYTNKPSAGLFTYEQEAAAAREAAKTQKSAAPTPTYAPAPAQPVGNGLIQPVPAHQYAASAPTQQYVAPTPAPASPTLPNGISGIEVPF